MLLTLLGLSQMSNLVSFLFVLASSGATWHLRGWWERRRAKSKAWQAQCERTERIMDACLKAQPSVRVTDTGKPHGLPYRGKMVIVMAHDADDALGMLIAAAKVQL